MPPRKSKAAADAVASEKKKPKTEVEEEEEESMNAEPSTSASSPPVVLERVYPKFVPVDCVYDETCCIACVRRCVLNAVENNDVARVKLLLGKYFDKKTQPFQADKAETAARMNCLRLAVEHGNRDLLEVLVEALPSLKLPDDAFRGFGEREMAPSVFEFLYGSSTSIAFSVLPKFVGVSMAFGNVKNVEMALRYCFDQSLLDVTELHVLALVARSRNDLTASLALLTSAAPGALPTLKRRETGVSRKQTSLLNAETINAPALESYITPLHLACLNPHVDVLACLLENGGDLTIAADVEGNKVHAICFAATTAEEHSSSGENPKKKAKGGVLEFPEETSKVLRLLLEHEDIQILANGSSTAGQELSRYNTTHAPLICAFRACRLMNAEALTRWQGVNSVKRFIDAHYGLLLQQAIQMGHLELLKQILDIYETRSNNIYGGLSVSQLVIRAIDLKMNHIFSYLVTTLTNPSDAYLQSAIEAENYLVVEQCVKEFNIAVNSGAFLHKAAEKGAVKVMEFFIKTGANAHVRFNSVPCLMQATRSGHFKCVELLVKSGVDVNDLNRNLKEPEKVEVTASTALPFVGMVFVTTGFFDMSKELINQAIENLGGRVVQAVSKNTTHCLCGRDGVTEWGQSTGKGSTKYKEAKKRKLPFVDEQYLKDQTSKFGGVMKNTNVSIDNAESDEEKVKWSLLHDVMKNPSWGIAETVKYLLSVGANARTLDDDGLSVLDYAVEFVSENDGTIEMFDALLRHLEENESGEDFANSSSESQMPLIVKCVKSGKFRFVKRLLNVPGIDVNVFDPLVPQQHNPEVKTGGDSLIFLLLSARQYDLVETALSLGADPNTVDLREGIACSLALLRSQGLSCEKGLRLLFSHPAFNFDVVDAAGNHLVHYFITAVNNMDPYEFITLLVESFPRIDVHPLNNAKQSALHLACRRPHCMMTVRFLLSKGLSLDALDELGNSPLSSAVVAYCEDLAIFLVDQGADVNSRVVTKVIKQQQQQQQFGRTGGGFGIAFGGGFGGGFGNPFGQPMMGAITATSSSSASSNAPKVEEEITNISVLRHALQNNNSLSSFVFYALQTKKLIPSETLKDAVKCQNVTLALKIVREYADSLGDDPAVVAELLHVFFSTIPPSKESNDHLNECVSILLSSQPSQEQRLKVLRTVNPLGQSVLHTVVLAKHHSSVLSKLLGIVEGHLDVFCMRDNEGFTLMHSVVRDANIDVLNMLLAHIRAQLASASADSPFRKTGSCDPINVLTTGCCVVNPLHGVTYAPDHEALSPLDYAVMPSSYALVCQLPEIGRLLLENGADPCQIHKGKSTAFRIGTLLELNHGQKLVANLLEHSASKDLFNQHLQMGLAERQKLIDQETKILAERRKELRVLLSKLDLRIQKLQEVRKKKMVEEEKEREEHPERFEIPIDQGLGYYYGQTYEVLVEGSTVWDCMLNQTDVSYGTFGHNKYYVIQLVKRVEDPNSLVSKFARRPRRYNKREQPFAVIQRWGRVGDYGESKVSQCKDVDAAKKTFCNKFYEKTKNDWENRTSFHKYPDKYEFVKRRYERKKAADSDLANKIPSRLPPQVQNVMTLVTDTTSMRQDMRNFGLSLDNLPLGGLSHEQLQSGYEILASLLEVVAELERLQSLRGKAYTEAVSKRSQYQAKTIDLTNKFYSIIPHDFGRSLPPTLDSVQVVKGKLSMLDSLSDLSIGLTLMMTEEDAASSSHLDAIYDNLGVDLSPLDPKSDEYSMIQQYIDRSKGMGSQNVRMASAFKVQRWEETIKFEPFIEDRKRTCALPGSTPANPEIRPSNLLLWHGTKTSNVLGILAKGLRIAPPEAPVSGYMFGKGVYFADVFAKSLGYVSVNYQHDGIIFLCEVDVGETYNRFQAEYLEGPAEDSESTLGMGRMVPSNDGLCVTPDGIGVPLGPLQDKGTPSHALNYNEFIVYDAARVQIRYMIRLTTRA